MDFEIPNDPPTVEFAFEKLIAYQAAVKFRDLIRPALLAKKAGTVELRDQLNRGSLSIITNLAEGAGRFSPPDKARFYLIASASTFECISLLDECAKERIIDDLTLRKARYAANAIVATLTRLINATKDRA